MSGLLSVKHPFSEAVSSWLRNPVALKELRGRMRGKRAYVILSVYLLILGVIASLAYASALASGGVQSADVRANAGIAVFSSILVVQFLAVLIVGPFTLANGISGERERKTWGLLRTTLLSTHSIIAGKMVAGLAYVLLLITSAVPLQAIAFMLGGVSFAQLALTQTVLVFTAMTFGLIALWASARLASTQLATTVTLIVCLFLIVAVPFVLIVTESAGANSWIWRQVDPELILATTNPVGALANIMSAYPATDRYVPAIGYLLLNALTINLLYLSTWRRLRDHVTS